jgi:hypothetical protein
MESGTIPVTHWATILAPIETRTPSNRGSDSRSHPDDASGASGRFRLSNAGLTKLEFVVSEMTVSCYMLRRPAEPDKDDIAAVDLFTVPTSNWGHSAAASRFLTTPRRDISTSTAT